MRFWPTQSLRRFRFFTPSFEFSCKQAMKYLQLRVRTQWGKMHHKSCRPLAIAQFNQFTWFTAPWPLRMELVYYTRELISQIKKEEEVRDREREKLVRERRRQRERVTNRKEKGCRRKTLFGTVSILVACAEKKPSHHHHHLLDWPELGPNCKLCFSTVTFPRSSSSFIFFPFHHLDEITPDRLLYIIYKSAHTLRVVFLLSKQQHTNKQKLHLKS